jgi:hypothetical protein
MITKYGTYIIYRCKHCKKTVNVPLHMEHCPQLEKYANFCTHEWEKIGEFKDAEINKDKSGSIQFS